jgi:hypothetical protein
MKVLIGLATRGNDIHPALVEWMLWEIGKSKYSVQLSMIISPHSAANGQQQVFEIAWEHGYDYVLIVDSDIIPPKGAVDKMVEDAKDILLAPIWFYDGHTKDIHLNVNFTGLGFSSRVYTPKATGIEKIKTASFGCIMVSRKVLQTFMEKGEKFTFTSPMLDQFTTYNHNSDSIFFKKAEIFGYEAWVDWSIQPTVHTRPVDLCNETLVNFLRKADLSLCKEFLVAKLKELDDRILR